MPLKHNITDEKWRSPSLIEWETFGRVGDSPGGEAYTKMQNVPTTLRMEDTGTYIYIGTAVPGSSESDAVWKICRLDTSSNKLWADGNALYDNVWSDRAVLNYS